MGDLNIHPPRRPAGEGAWAEELPAPEGRTHQANLIQGAIRGPSKAREYGTGLIDFLLQ